MDEKLFTDPLHRRIYAVDSSIYEVEPIAVAVPKNQDELIRLLEYAAHQSLPAIARGAGTGIAGGCIGRGLVLDLAKHLNKIVEINIEEEYAIVETGVVQDQLNAALAPHGYRLGPNTSTGNRATIGGMVGNNSAGSHSLKYGVMADAVLEIVLALAGGEVIHFGPCSEQQWKEKCNLHTREGEIYRTLEQIRTTHALEIRKRFHPLPRRSTGYNLPALIESFPLNVCKLIAGSEGSFGIATQIKVAISKVPKSAGVVVLHYTSIEEGFQRVEELLKYNPIAIEMIDAKILEMGRHSPELQSQLGWLKGSPAMLLVVETEDATTLKEIANAGLATESLVLIDPATIQQIWNVRKTGLGLLLSKRSYSRAISFIEDLSVPPDTLSRFIPELTSYLRSKGKEAGIYGHAGAGCLHIRPYIDTRDAADRELMELITRDTAAMILKYGGALSGEHGDGYTRSWLNEMMYGPTLYHAFKELKGAFDPHNLMNPDKVVNGPPLLRNLRNDKPLKKIDTFLDFSQEGGFALSADLCNGNGACRKREGVMCPSFQATRDEFDTTRARAQSLRGIITGRLPYTLASPEIQEVLDLCLSCKGCKKECPSQVDMAKMKAEALYQYQEEHGYSLRSRLIGRPSKLYHWATKAPRLFNWLKETRFSKTILEWIGFTPHRSLPNAAQERFSTWFAKYEQPKGTKEIAFFLDTFTEFNDPHIGKALVQLLNLLNYHVSLIPYSCCGRPLISKGMLREAKEYAGKIEALLVPYVNNNTPIIGIEPSCLSALTDDYQGLIGKRFPVLSVAEFLAKEDLSQLQWKKEPQHIKVHGHCHQRALIGVGPTLEVLRKIPGLHVEEIPSGCCGVAGSFGYEKEHYTLSMKIGELVLLPEVLKSEGVIIADGTSCRHQIHDGSEVKALHLVELLLRRLAL